MQRYLVFAGHGEDGGWSDFIGSFDEPEKAVKHAEKGDTDGNGWEWWHVIDGYSGNYHAINDHSPEDLAIVNEALGERLKALKAPA